MNELFPHWEYDKPDPNIKYDDVWTKLKNVSVTTDPVQRAADFYILFAIVSKNIINFPTISLTPPEDLESDIKILRISESEVEERNRKYFSYLESSPLIKLEKIVDQASDELDKLISLLDLIFLDYSIAAIGGELRHHPNNTCLGKGGGYRQRFISWVNWYFVYQKYGVELFKEAEEIFLDFPSSSYGGKPWANAAKLVYDRLNLNLANSLTENQYVFIDRVFNLQHNTGSFLNKVVWANLRGNDNSIENMHETVLKAHSANIPDLTMLYDNASLEVQGMVNNLMKIAIENNLNINCSYEERILNNE